MTIFTLPKRDTLADPSWNAPPPGAIDNRYHRTRHTAMKQTPFRRLPYFIVLVLITAVVCGCAGKERLYYAAPTLLPGTDRAMKTDGYWAGRHPFPDRIILDRQGIADLNRQIRDELGLTRDIVRIESPVPGKRVRDRARKMLDSCAGRTLYRADGTAAGPEFYAALADLMDLDAIPSDIPVRWGLIVRYTDQRSLPTAAPLYAKQHDRDFDRLQNSALDIGTPVAVTHATTDGQWYYVIDQLSGGWIPAEAVALCSLEEMRRFAEAEPFAVVTRAKGALFRDAGLREYHDYARMGTRLPLAGMEGGVAGVLLPVRDDDGTLSEQTGYMRSEDIHEGFLSYTPRAIIRQAFELLNAPYGWGGMYGEQDCSRFVQEVFATVGISLPRNSSKQARAGELIGEYPDGAGNGEKLDAFSKQAIGGCTLLYMQGHIMLFLGMVDGVPYAIHSTWGYRDPAPWKERIRVINRVAVTNMSLGEGSKRGSYLDRLRSIRVLAPSRTGEGTGGSKPGVPVGS